MNRYSLTYKHTDRESKPPRVRYGIWIRPRIGLGGYRLHTIAPEEVGRLDKVAKMYYDDERLWWAIADFNNIGNMLQDTYLGKVLRIPLLSQIESAQYAYPFRV